LTKSSRQKHPNGYLPCPLTENSAAQESLKVVSAQHVARHKTDSTSELSHIPFLSFKACA
jgi:hypothetical protein